MLESKAFWLPLTLLWTTSATNQGQLFYTNSSLADMDVSLPSFQLAMDASYMSSTTCATICSTQGPSCRAFSIQKPASNSGTTICKTSDNATQLIGASGVEVYIVGLPGRKILEACITSEQCPTNAICSNGICYCNSGLEASYDSHGCVKIPTVDSSGFQHYFDGYAYKRAPAGRASSLPEAREMCSGIGASLPVPYGVRGVGVKSLQALRTFARPGEEFYIGLALSGSYSMKTFITDNGTIVDANAMSTDTAQFWAPGEPNAMSDTEAAAVTMTTSGWQDKPINTPVNTVICSKWSGYTLNTMFGKYYKVHLEVLPTGNASLACNTEGGQLALTYGAMGAQIIQYYRDAYNGLEYWLDGTDVVQEGLWVFSDGTALNASLKGIDPLQHWVLNEPNAGTGGNCLLAWNYGWGDNPCSMWYASLCERTF